MMKRYSRMKKGWANVSNLAVVAVLATTVAVVCGIAGMRSAKVHGKTEITFWCGWTGDELTALKGFIEKFNEMHPDYYVKTTTVAGSYEKMKISFAGGDAPDVCSTVWLNDLADYSLRGALTPLDEYMARDGITSSSYYPAQWNAMSIEGRPYAMCMSMGAVFMLYNKKIFREVGLDPERPPRTLEEFDEYAEKCTKFRNNDPINGEIERLGYTYDNIINWNAAFGVQYWDEKTRTITYNNERTLAELKWQKSNVDKYGGYQRLRSFYGTFGNTTSPNNPFLSGKVAMVTVGDWYKSIIEQYENKNDPMEYGWFALPAPEGGCENSMLLQASLFVIPASSKKKEIAWEFLKYITSAYPSENFHVGDSPGNLPALVECAVKPQYQTAYWQFVKMLYASPNSVGPPQMPLFDMYVKELFRVEEFVMSGVKTPEQAAGELDRMLQPELDAVYANINKRRAKLAEK